MPIEYFFPTPIYFSFANNLNIIQEEVENYLKTIESINLTNPWGDTVQTTFKYGVYDHILDQTPLLQEEIKSHCANFLSNLRHQYSNISIKESWLNISSKNNFQHYHLHDDNDLSGVYYYQTNGNDGDIVFSNPSLVNKYHKITSNIDKTIKYKPEVGKIILFPSFLEHAVFHNTTDNQRISVTFNIKIS